MDARKLVTLAAVLVLTACGGGGTGSTDTSGDNNPAPPTVTPPVTAAAPTVAIDVNPTSLVLGGSSTLTWSSTNATSCTASGSWAGNQSVSGSATVTPTSAGPYTYTLACTGAGGSASSSATLSVTPSPAAPTAPTVSINVNPTSMVQGQSSTLSWISTNATACTGSGSWSGNQGISGSTSLTPMSAGTYTYTLTCTGAGGSASNSATLSVTAPAPTVAISVNPTSIVLGQSSTLTWSSTNTTTCTASGSWTGNTSVSGSTTVTPTSAGTSIYTLACTGAGGTVSKSVGLSVTAPAPTVAISVNPTSIVLGQSSTLTRSSTNSTACTASGSWTGNQSVSGSGTVTPTSAATYTYTLACTGAGGTVSNSASLSVTTPPPVVVTDPNSCYDASTPSTKPSTDRVDAAVKSGDPSGLQSTDQATLLKCATTKATALRKTPQQVLADIYNTKGGVPDLSINISHYSNAIISAGFSQSIPYIVSDSGNGIAAIVAMTGASKTGRGMAYGADVLNWMSGTSNQQQHRPLFNRAFTWLMTGHADGPLPATIAFSQSSYNSNSVKNYITGLGKTATEVTCNVADPTNTCWQSIDLFVFGESVPDNAGLATLVQTYLKAGKSVIYMNSDWNIGAGAYHLLGGMGMTSGSGPGGPGNWFDSGPGYSVASGRTADDSLARADMLGKVVTTLNLLAQASYTQDFSATPAPPAIDGVNLIRNDLSGYETRGKKIFATENTDLQRLLVLWADEWRPNVSYSQISRANDPANFLRAYASDSWLAYNRTKTTTNPNGQGDYMPAAAQQLATSTTDETIVVTLPQGNGVTAIGRGAIPARAVAVQIVSVPTGVNLGLQTSYIRTFGNPLKDSSYARPRQPNSWTVPLQSGAVNDFVSPSGGPLFLNYSGATAGQTVTLKIKGVVQYAHFDFSNGTPSSAELSNAMTAQQAKNFGWTTFKSRSGEVQQLVSIGLQSFQYGMTAGAQRTPQDLVADRFQSIVMDTNHIANGYNDMAMATEVSTLCTAFGWDCTGSTHNAPGTQHFVSWLAACGGGCSGQPIDNDGWAMSAGWGWAHELGHNTVQPWMHIVMPSGKGCAVECDNNTLSSADVMRLYALRGDDYSGNNTDYAGLYQMIQANRATNLTGEPLRADMETRLWDMPQQNAMRAMYFELAFLYTQTRHGETKPTLNSTLEFLTLMSKSGRLVAKADSTTWTAAVGDQYGMGTYTDTQRSKIPNYELLYVLGSKIVGQDLRNIFTMYGLPLSTTATDSVARLNLCVAQQKFYQLAVGKANQLSTGSWGSLESLTQTPLVLNKCAS